MQIDKNESLKQEIRTLLTVAKRGVRSISETGVEDKYIYQLRGYVIVWDDKQGSILKVQLPCADYGSNDVKFFCSKVEGNSHFHNIIFKKSSDNLFDLPFPESLKNIRAEELGLKWTLEVQTKIEKIANTIRQLLLDSNNWIILD